MQCPKDGLLVQFYSCDVAAIFSPSDENMTELMLVDRFGEKRKAMSKTSAELFNYSVPDSSSLVASTRT